MQRVLLSTRTALVSEIMSICECDNIQNCRKIEKIISYLSWRKLYNWQSKNYWSTFRHFDEFFDETREKKNTKNNNKPHRNQYRRVQFELSWRSNLSNNKVFYRIIVGIWTFKWLLFFLFGSRYKKNNMNWSELKH